mgnify:CR=1
DLANDLQMTSQKKPDRWCALVFLSQTASKRPRKRPPNDLPKKTGSVV